MKKIRTNLMSIVVLSALVSLLGCTGDPLTYCIAEGTQIATPTGQLLIEKLQVGDIVYSYNIATSSLEPSKVMFIKKSNQLCYQFRVSDNIRLTATSSHPFYSPQTGKYELAEKWVEKELTQFAFINQNQSYISLPSNSVVPVGKKIVYDITVESPHANFIANGFLVHNKTPPYEGTAQIDDLEVISKSDSSLTLHWTVPGNSSIFTESYDMRISDSSISVSSSWYKQDTVLNMPTPSAYGTKDTVEVIGLLSNQKYWFTMQTISNKGFHSGFGKVVVDSML